MVKAVRGGAHADLADECDERIGKAAILAVERALILEQGAMLDMARYDFVFRECDDRSAGGGYIVGQRRRYGAQVRILMQEFVRSEYTSL
jgi:hypothetical protein